MDLEFWDCCGRKNLHLITEEKIWYLELCSMFRKENKHLKGNRKELELRKKKRLPDCEPYRSVPGMSRLTEMPSEPNEPKSRQNGNGVKRRLKKHIRRQKLKLCSSMPVRIRCNRRSIIWQFRHIEKEMNLKECSGKTQYHTVLT